MSVSSNRVKKSSWAITKTQVSFLRVPLIQPFRTALGDHDSLENLLFTIKLSDGRIGYGEAAIATHITGETIKDTKDNLKKIGEALIGKDVRDYLALSVMLHERLSTNPAALAAIEMAILDAFTKKLNIPLWKMFGERCHHFSTDITIVIGGLAETQDTAKAYYEQGFRQFKVKIGRDQDLDVKRLLVIKEVAPKAAIYLDANQGYTAKEMIQFLQTIKNQGISPALLEQPVPRDDREGLTIISRITDIPVCADESARSFAETIELIEKNVVDVINIKLMKFGLIHGREIALLAKSRGIDLMIGGMMETSLAMTAAAHLAAGLGCFKYVDLDTPFFIKHEITNNPYLSSQGVYNLSSVKSGIGISKT